jgi:hypothetical protein
MRDRDERIDIWRWSIRAYRFARGRRERRTTSGHGVDRVSGSQSTFVEVASRDAFALIAAKDRGSPESGRLRQISHMLHLLAALAAFAIAGPNYLTTNYGDRSFHRSYRCVSCRPVRRRQFNPFKRENGASFRP